MFDPRQSVTSESVFLVGVYSTRDAELPDVYLDELASLVDAAGGNVVGRTFQRGLDRGAERDGLSQKPRDPATFIGRGKAEHLAELIEAHEANLVVFDNELSPAQIRELEKILECRVIDRSELILDIFASRAHTNEAKLQVELAQLEYTAPRLRGMWTHLERQAGTGGFGGLGTRGPGEKQIEIDRRIVTKRLSRLKNETQRIASRKEREVRQRISKQFCVGLVGYTNAGKSTLLNRVTEAETYAANKLFATLDTKTRRWTLAPGVDVLLSDTVGFVRDLPHYLVASFRSTLEEALNADLLLHVIDASHPNAADQIDAVEAVLTELGCDKGRIVPVLNKVDAVRDPDHLTILRSRVRDAVVISAATGEGLDALVELIIDRRSAEWTMARICVPPHAGKILAMLRSRSRIISETFDETTWDLLVYASPELLANIERIEPGSVRYDLVADDAGEVAEATVLDVDRAVADEIADADSVE